MTRKTYKSQLYLIFPSFFFADGGDQQKADQVQDLEAEEGS